jgi:hypothetical protein
VPPALPTPSPPTEKPHIFVEQYANDSIRIRVGFNAVPFDDLPGAILPNPRKNAQSIVSGSNVTAVENGNIMASITGDTIIVSRKSDGQALFSLLSTTVLSTTQPGYYAWTAVLQGWEDEKIWGMGEHDSPSGWAEGLDYKTKGKTSTLSFRNEQKNTHITIRKCRMYLRKGYPALRAADSGTLLLTS